MKLSKRFKKVLIFKNNFIFDTEKDVCDYAGLPQTRVKNTKENKTLQRNWLFDILPTQTRKTWSRTKVFSDIREFSLEFA